MTGRGWGWAGRRKPTHPHGRRERQRSLGYDAQLLLSTWHRQATGFVDAGEYQRTYPRQRVLDPSYRRDQFGQFYFHSDADAGDSICHPYGRFRGQRIRRRSGACPSVLRRWRLTLGIAGLKGRLGVVSGCARPKSRVRLPDVWCEGERMLISASPITCWVFTTSMSNILAQEV